MLGKNRQAVKCYGYRSLCTFFIDPGPYVGRQTSGSSMRVVLWSLCPPSPVGEVANCGEAAAAMSCLEALLY
jgi:hypothetical protein